MGGSSDFVFRRNMSPFSGSFSVFVSSLLHTLFRFFSSIFVRFDKEQSSLVNETCSFMEPAAMPQKAESDVSRSDDDSEYYDAEEEKETPEPSFVFKFEYQTKAVLEAMEKVNAYGHSSVVEKENEFLPEKFSSRRYEFQAEKHVSFYEEEAKVASFVVREASADDSNCGSMVIENEGVKELVTEECVQKEEAKVASFVLKEESAENSNFGSIVTEDDVVEQLVAEECVRKEIHIPQDSEKKQVGEDSHTDKDEQLKSQEHDEKNVASHEDKFLQEKEYVVVESASDSDSDSSSLCSSPEVSFMGQFSDDGFLLETEFGERVEFGALEDIDLQNIDVGYEPDEFDEEDEDVMEQLEELEQSTRNDEQHNPKESTPEGFTAKDEKPNEGLENSEKVSGQDLAANDSGDPNTLETLWEHQELIEQLKMELKKVRGSGLPTILEESESPNMEDLKPWKIDEKYHHGDRMSVLHKFYKSYRERMRKFDILSYQKLYAIGFLQSKDTLETFSSCKSSTPAIKSFLLQNFGLCKPKKNSDSDPMVKFIRELHSELEVVYIGQLCLSWEFLQWQYEKALEIWEYDEYGLRSYNEVAEEFQQFQVLMQRFVENERFQGPRVEHYVKNRCVMRNLMQIPVIREDSMKIKKKAKRGKDIDDAIGSDLLVEILQESIRTMWRFIRADKSANTADACRKRSKLELEDSLDPKLLAEVQADLQKKERKLKELLRSENCILKRFKKQHEEEEEEESPEHLYFFCQVDIRLVSRVLNMSSITSDQLVWCHNKLSRIHVVNRKIRVDPSFLLFPC
ncbi:PREDICTED: uncharacterized protein LOC101314873 isoform X1 [Fragaria vesca subsp. vesca]|uniref:uncharacterized protein LOC101314873 isoform X1 n=2 Tax=Fragaria vesca subsp. vesca TaxID=101020 RepID=UPI0002C3422C|nr:PREDICTED: uncharacterized protein LOC101314873 isoform X1 [Fragaria vesca subsp. vesca]XP_011467969.1 PREDICTED: uncharacterized protein LOC101314873 isoform X1 [Fragaria vesca subsp. vesca]